MRRIFYCKIGLALDQFYEKGEVPIDPKDQGAISELFSQWLADNDPADLNIEVEDFEDEE